MFPPITGKLQKIKINEKFTIFENFDGKKVQKAPLFSIFWHSGNYTVRFKKEGSIDSDQKHELVVLKK